MRTDVEIVAGAGGRLRWHATGGLAVRRTGPHALHLIGTAATPLGGDEIDIRVVVEAGARLNLRTVAATMALPAPQRRDSTARWHLEVAERARLWCEPEPTIVAAGADHRAVTYASVAPSATVLITEHAQIGRGLPADIVSDDARGRWSGRLSVDVGDHPVLRHRLLLDGVGAPPVAHRASSSVFRYPDERPEVVSSNDFAVRLRLAEIPSTTGGAPTTATLTTASGDGAVRTRAMCDELERSEGPRPGR